MHGVKGRLFSHTESSEAGFTLWELLLVLMCMGMILHALTPNYKSSVEPLKQEIDKGNIQEIEGAAQNFRIDTGTYPSSVDELLEKPAGVSGWRGPYLREWPTNPWNELQPYTIDASGHAVSRR